MSRISLLINKWRFFKYSTKNIDRNTGSANILEFRKSSSRRILGLSKPWFNFVEYPRCSDITTLSRWPFRYRCVIVAAKLRPRKGPLLRSFIRSCSLPPWRFV